MSSVTSWPDKEKQQSEENKDNTKENETHSSEQSEEKTLTNAFILTSCCLWLFANFRCLFSCFYTFYYNKNTFYKA